MVFINQVNKDNADFRGTYNAIEQAFGSKVLPIELPIIEGGKMTGWVDILTGKAYKLSAPEQEIDVPADMKSEVEELKGRLVELAAETDDALIEKYFEGEELTAEELEKGVRQAILNDSLMPLMAGNATTSVGVANLMDKICKFMPSPVRDVKRRRRKRRCMRRKRRILRTSIQSGCRPVRRKTSLLQSVFGRFTQRRPDAQHLLRKTRKSKLALRP